MKQSNLYSILFVYLSIMGATHAIAQESSCNYFGLNQPTTAPKDFNPEVLDLEGSFKFNVAFRTCNEIYFTTIDAKENIYVSKKRNNRWSTPKISSFSNPSFSDADPFLTKDGQSIYFISDRPTHATDTSLDWNIWHAATKNGTWENPIPLPKPINSDESDEYFFSISDKGNAYFSSNRKGGEGSFDIYTVAVLNDHQFSEPRNVGAPISTESYEFDPYISPDEKFMVFSINEKGNSSLYYSSKNRDGKWKVPINLGAKINITRQDFAPSLSMDGMFLFYSNNGKLKWVNAAILNIPDHN